MRLLSMMLALALMGVPALPVERPQELTVEAVVSAIQTESAKTAAETLLDWIEQGNLAEAEAVLEVLEEIGLEPAQTAAAFARVLDEADACLAERKLDRAIYEQGVRSLSPLFTQVLTTASTPFAPEPIRNPADLAQLYGMWYDSELQELLILTEQGCRVVIPWLGYLGEANYAVRLRDRSANGQSPALEIDIHESGVFLGALTYYVSGADETHFWSLSQAQRFDRIG